MSSDPKEILAEFGIDVNGKDPDGQYQWKMLAMQVGSPERTRLEKAWSAFVLGRKEVDLPKKPEPTTDRSADKGAPSKGIGGLGAVKKRWMLLGLGAIGIAVLWLYMHDRRAHRASVEQAAVEWQVKYEAIKPMLNESGHDDEHHDEFVLLAEAAKAAIQAGQGEKMLERINADLAAERTAQGAMPISAMASHTAQWKIIVQALVMNKVELLDHEKFKGHHEGEL